MGWGTEDGAVHPHTVWCSVLWLTALLSARTGRCWRNGGRVRLGVGKHLYFILFWCKTWLQNSGREKHFCYPVTSWARLHCQDTALALLRECWEWLHLQEPASALLHFCDATPSTLQTSTYYSSFTASPCHRDLPGPSPCLEPYKETRKDSCYFPSYTKPLAGDNVAGCWEWNLNGHGKLLSQMPGYGWSTVSADQCKLTFALCWSQVCTVQASNPGSEAPRRQKMPPAICMG